MDPEADFSLETSESIKRGGAASTTAVEEMERRGFPRPDEVPDATFKQPGWMKKGGA
jgi:hypothetical protein